jgi:hypothetical protein
MAGNGTDKMSSLAHQPPFRLLPPIAALHILLLPLPAAASATAAAAACSPAFSRRIWLSTVDILHGAAV